MDIDSTEVWTPKNDAGSARWFCCPGCNRVVTSLVRAGRPHPDDHHYYSYTHCCKICEQGQNAHSQDEWATSVPDLLFRQVHFHAGLQHYLLHNPGSEKPLPALLFLHGAHHASTRRLFGGMCANWWTTTRLPARSSL